MAKRAIEVKAHVKHMPMITVTFMCQRCEKTFTYEQYPGPVPKWCLNCYPDVRKEQARDRMRRRRARLAGELGDHAGD